MLLGLFTLLIGQVLGSGFLQILLKFALTEYPPVFLSVLRFIIATLGIIIIIFLSKRHSFFGKNTVSLIKRSFFFAANIVIFAIAIQYTTVVMGQIIGLTVPVLVAILSHFVLGERITKEKIVGFFFALIGVSFLIFQSITKTGQHLSFGTPLGNVLILGSCLAWSLYIVFSRKVASFHSSIRTTFVNFTFTAIGLSLLVPFEFSTKMPHVASITDLATVSLILFGLLTVIQYIAMQYGIKHTSASTVSFFQYLAPAIAALFAVPFLHEKITTNLIIGTVFILFGVFFATTYPLLKKR